MKYLRGGFNISGIKRGLSIIRVKENDDTLRKKSTKEVRAKKNSEKLRTRKNVSNTDQHCKLLLSQLAVKALLSDGMATDSSEVYSKLLGKHPQNDNVYTEFKGISETIKTTRETVLKALLSFPKDTASGLSNLKARHLIDLAQNVNSLEAEMFLSID
ncbi:hypothetical protein ROZALSC1DRAFT_25560 [Rozella allomycis CSF55]|uniref:Uncharacterized protein n=1 Tax=Rozella allomycis (strain CSF55) TaxID=988480 RepID=A0A4V1IYY6_ROZAC|nr:hypothetical protein ROZALSC1DRAFT_25560 [Rozella allomycis CSF55]